MAVVIADEALDTRVDAFDNDLRKAVGGDREDPRLALAQKRKELADKLRETQKEIAALGKKPRKAKG